MTKLTASLPKGEANGLDSIARDLIDSPDQVQVVLVDCKSVTTDMDTGDVVPTARIRRVEPIKQDKHRVMLMLRRATRRALPENEYGKKNKITHDRLHLEQPDSPQAAPTKEN